MVGRWSRERGRRHLLTLALAMGALLATVLLVGVFTRPGQVADGAVATAIYDSLPASLRLALDGLARPRLPLLLAPVAVLLFLLALVRRRWVEALAAAVLPPTIVLTRWLREDVILRPQLGVPGYTDNTFPSTHATGGYVVVTALALLWPSRGNRVVRLMLWAITLVIAVGNVAWYAHRPSDVVGSYAMVQLVAALALLPFTRRSAAGEGRGERPQPRQPDSSTRP